MNLQEFVSKTLQQIATGVATAQNLDSRIAPKIGLGEYDPKILRTRDGAGSVAMSTS